MKRIIACCTMALLLLRGTVYADQPDPSTEVSDVEATTDIEQQQLEWCFTYSNLLGYDIEYIEEPRLFRTVSQWTGTPYRYGGHTRKGIDCSGFANVLYTSVYGMPLQGGSAEIYQHVTPIERSELREGDLLFFKIRPSRISHVGVYLGQDKFAHASVQLGVIVSDLNEPYYKMRFFKGGRCTPKK